MRVRVVSAGCGHVRIESLSGRVLHVLTMDELQQNSRASEEPLVVALRVVIRNHVLSGGAVTLNAFRTVLEGFEF